MVMCSHQGGMGAFFFDSKSIAVMTVLADALVADDVLESSEGITPAAFKQAMRHLGGTACVITVSHENMLGGLTATSVTAVSAEPAEILVCVNQSSSAWPLLRDSGLFGVNVLGAEQRQLAEQFAGVGGLKAAERYQGHAWRRSPQGILLAEEAPAALACETVHIVERHSHALVFGRVLHVHHAQLTSASPLLYWNAGFGQFIAA